MSLGPSGESQLLARKRGYQMAVVERGKVLNVAKKYLLVRSNHRNNDQSTTHPEYVDRLK